MKAIPSKLVFQLLPDCTELPQTVVSCANDDGTPASWYSHSSIRMRRRISKLFTPRRPAPHADQRSHVGLGVARGVQQLLGVVRDYPEAVMSKQAMEQIGCIF